MYNIYNLGNKTYMKTRIITQNSFNNIKNILTKMNSKTEYADDGYSFSAKILNRLSVGDQAEFVDGRHFIQKIPAESQMRGETKLVMGKTQLTIDNQSGRIIKSKKPFYKSWKTVLKNADKYLNIIAENLENSKIVKQHKITIFGFTKNGAEKIKKLQKKVNNITSKSFFSNFRINFYNNI